MAPPTAAAAAAAAAAVLAMSVPAQAAGLASAASCQLPGEWTGAQILDEAHTATLKWRVVGDEVELGVVATAASWVALGQTAGGWFGADLVTIVAADGAVSVQDRHVPPVAFPFLPHGEPFTLRRDSKADTIIPTSPSAAFIEDTDAGGCADWALVDHALIEDSCFMAVVRRGLVAQDSFDRTFSPGEGQRLVWAFGQAGEPSLGADNQGTFRFDVGAAAPDEEVLCEGCGSVSLLMDNFPVPTRNNATRVCGAFAMPATLRSAVAFDAVVQRPEHVQSMMLHVCAADSAAYKEHAAYEGPCLAAQDAESPGTSLLDTSKSGCESVLYAWSAGARGFILPSDSGFLMGEGEGAVRRLVLEVLYVNPGAAAEGLRDNSGLRVVTSDALRPKQASVIALGDPLSRLPDMMHGESTVQAVAKCPSQCTSRFPEPVHVIGSFLHMGAFGSRVWHNRFGGDGSFAETTDEAAFWDAAHQQTAAVDFTINPGDAMQLVCEYDTSKWPEPLTFGLGSAFDEACVAYLVVDRPIAYRMCGGHYPIVCGNSTADLIFETAASPPVVRPPALHYRNESQQCQRGDGNNEAPTGSSAAPTASPVPDTRVSAPPTEGPPSSNKDDDDNDDDDDDKPTTASAAATLGPSLLLLAHHHLPW